MAAEPGQLQPAWRLHNPAHVDTRLSISTSRLLVSRVHLRLTAPLPNSSVQNLPQVLLLRPFVEAEG